MTIAGLVLTEIDERLKSRGCGEKPDHPKTRNPQLPASSLDSLEFRHKVCVLCLPPGFPAVPHYIILAQLSVRTLSEPDVRC
jgi:hypothetical protein